MKKRKIMKGLVCIAIGAIIAVTGHTLAYLTDREEVKHIFTVGKIDISLTQPELELTEPVLPMQRILTQPVIKNQGDNDAFLFVQVDVPCANVMTATVDGKKCEAADTELFTWEMEPEWIAVGEVVKDEERKVHTYTYAYGSDQQLVPFQIQQQAVVYSSVQVANIVEGQGLEEQNLKVELRAYGIQTDHLAGADASWGDGDGDALRPQQVWEVLYEQTRYGKSSQTMTSGTQIDTVISEKNVDEASTDQSNWYWKETSETGQVKETEPVVANEQKAESKEEDPIVRTGDTTNSMRWIIDLFAAVTVVVVVLAARKRWS